MDEGEAAEQIVAIAKQCLRGKPLSEQESMIEDFCEALQEALEDE